MCSSIPTMGSSVRAAPHLCFFALVLSLVHYSIFHGGPCDANTCFRAPRLRVRKAPGWNSGLDWVTCPNFHDHWGQGAPRRSWHLAFGIYVGRCGWGVGRQWLPQKNDALGALRWLLYHPGERPKLSPLQLQKFKSKNFLFQFPTTTKLKEWSLSESEKYHT